jgi:hypothetical protein
MLELNNAIVATATTILVLVPLPAAYPLAAMDLYKTPKNATMAH